MNMFNRGTEDTPLHPLSLFLGGGGERPLRPPLDPSLQSTGGGRSPFWRKTFKNDEKFGFGSPYLPPLLRKSGSAPGLLWKKNIGPYI
jgi:hypothetical protein